MTYILTLNAFSTLSQYLSFVYLLFIIIVITTIIYNNNENYYYCYYYYYYLCLFIFNFVLQEF